MAAGFLRDQDPKLKPRDYCTGLMMPCERKSVEADGGVYGA